MIDIIIQSFLPLIVPVLAALVILVVGAVLPKARLLFWLSLVALLIGSWTLNPLDAGGAWTIGNLFLFDSFGVFFIRALYAVTLVVAILGVGSLDKDTPSPEVFYAVLLFALVGMAIVVSTTHFAVFFLGLEIYTACLYILIAFFSNRPSGDEAAIKYLILGAVSSGFILLGIALLYLGFGSLEIPVVAERLLNAAALDLPDNTAIWLAGSLCLFIGVGFKLSLVPFHMWAPDVYQGAPTAVTALIATASKMAILAIAIRYLSLFSNGAELTNMLIPIVVASIVIGNLLALFQQNLKRLLAYSSIAHMGYAFVPLCLHGTTAWSASLIYLFTYVLTALAAFALIVMEEGEHADAGSFDHYRGLGHQRPLRASGIALVFFSLAGIPMTAGFIGKWSIFQAALAGQQWLLVGAVIAGAGLGAFYYLRVVANLYFVERRAEAKDVPFACPVIVKFIVVVLLLKILVVGLYPEPLFHQVKRISPDQTLYGAACCQSSDSETQL